MAKIELIREGTLLAAIHHGGTEYKGLMREWPIHR
jgi:hypothetical protein